MYSIRRRYEGKNQASSVDSGPEKEILASRLTQLAVSISYGSFSWVYFKSTATTRAPNLIVIKALLFGVYIRALDIGKLQFRSLASEGPEVSTPMSMET